MASEYHTISRVDSDIDHSIEAFNSYENEYPPNPGPLYADVGVVRVSLSIANEEFLVARGDPLISLGDQIRKYRK